jgi:hypothetical protein
MNGQFIKKKKKEACEMLLKVYTEVEPVAVKGDKRKSVLFDACILAKELSKSCAHLRSITPMVALDHTCSRTLY